MQNENTVQNQNFEIVSYHINAATTIPVRKIGEDWWLNVKQIAEFYGTSRQNIEKHIKAIFAEKELDKDSVCKFWLHTAEDGKQYNTAFYNMDMIIAIGYRVKSDRGIIFRQWTTGLVKQKITGECEQTYIQPAPAYTEFEIFNFFSNLVYLPIKTISQITKIGVWVFQKQCKAGKLEARYVHIKGENNHPHYEIAVSSLDIDSKKKIFEHLKTQNQLSLLINKAKNIQQMLLTDSDAALTDAKMLLSNDLILTNGKGWSYDK